MLIVSQNEEKMVNINNCIDISLVKEYGQDEEIDIVKYVGIAYKGPYSGGVLGYYKTEERAKEVLEEIISKYVEHATLKNDVGDIRQIYDLPKFYRMPLE